jgi:hypothetical protein
VRCFEHRARPLALQANFGYQKVMGKSTVSGTRKKIGRPKHPTVSLHVRFEPEGVARMDGWRRHQGDDPSRPEAIRRLVELGLKAKGR